MPFFYVHTFTIGDFVKVLLGKALLLEKAVKGLLGEKIKREVSDPLFELEDALDCALRIERKKMMRLEEHGRELVERFFSETAVAALKTDADISANNARYHAEFSKIKQDEGEMLDSEIEINIRPDLVIPAAAFDALDIPGEYRRVLRLFAGATK